MTWRVLVINEHAKLSYQNNSLIYRSNARTEKLHISEIHTVLLETTDITLTTALICKLVKNNVRIIFCDEKRNPIGEVNPYYGCHDVSRKISEQIGWDPFIQQVVWTNIIEQKIRNQCVHLKNLGEIHAAEQLSQYKDGLQLGDPTNREGHAAKVYFNTLFGKSFSRDREENEVNAFLNYGYSLILSIFNREIIKNGHLTQIGIKHKNYFNPYNLSSDLMEPFRIIIDQKVKSIDTTDFSKRKHALFQIFSELYEYNNQKMYLTNVIEHYVKKVLDALDKNDPSIATGFLISEL